MATAAIDIHRPLPPKEATAPLSFPLSYSKAFSQWWGSNRASAEDAQGKVLSFLPFFPTSDGIRESKVNLVHLSGDNRAINEFEIVRKGEEVKTNLVMLHGYGGGLGLFYRNFDELSKIKGTRIYALDLLGMGISSRPSFKIKAKESKSKLDEAEAFFIDALEEWRQEKKIEKMILLGHSLGAYLSVDYCIKYPAHVEKLILVSPVGVPHNPYESTTYNEHDPDVILDDSSSTQPRSELIEPAAPRKVDPPRKTRRLLSLLWNYNVSPFSFARLPIVGPKFASGWTTRRFQLLPTQKEQDALHDYSYQIFRRPGSGEYALPYLLAPGAYARRPLMERMKLLKAGVLKRVLWIYGGWDWMDMDAGLEASMRLPKAIRTDVVIVEEAGHNVHLDGPVEFNRILMTELRDEEIKRTDTLEYMKEKWAE